MGLIEKIKKSWNNNAGLKIGAGLLTAYLAFYTPGTMAAQNINQKSSESYSVSEVIKRKDHYQWAEGAAIAELAPSIPGKEIILASAKPYLDMQFKGVITAYCKTAIKGEWEPLWEYESNSFPANLDITDVNNDGVPELIASGFGYITEQDAEDRDQMVMLDATGKPIWKGKVTDDLGRKYKDFMIRDVVSADIFPEPGKEIISVGGSNTGSYKGGMLQVWNSANGELLMNIDVVGTSQHPHLPNWYGKLQSIAQADIDNDGRTEFVVTGGWNEFGNVHALRINSRHSWEKLWDVHVGNDSWDVEIADLYKHIPGKEIVVPSAYRNRDDTYNRVTMLDSTGKKIWAVDLDKKTNIDRPVARCIDVVGSRIAVGYGVVQPEETRSDKGVLIMDKYGGLVYNLALPGAPMIMESGKGRINDEACIALQDKENNYLLASTTKGLYVINQKLHDFGRLR